MARWPLIVGLLSVTSVALGCAHDARIRPAESSRIEITPTTIADGDVARMLVGRWDGRQDGAWGRNPWRTLIIDRVSGVEGAWQAEGRWGYTDRCCMRVPVRVERSASHLMLTFVGPVNDRYTFSTADGHAMQGRMRFDYDAQATLQLYRIPTTARALPPPAPISSMTAVAGAWSGVWMPPGAPSVQVRGRINEDGAYEFFRVDSGRRIGRGTVTPRESHAEIKGASGAAGTLTLHQHEGDRTLRLVFSGGTVADLTPVKE